MKYYFVSGEPSGDLHGANLMKALKNADPGAGFRFWGGDKMAAVGGEPVKHIRDLAFMGFTEVLMNLREILKNIKLCKEDIVAWKPDVVILIDYPGFNLRIAEFLKKAGIKVYYYISPQLWAWKAGRVELVRKYVDRMLVILPFEKDFYARYGIDVDYVGHPLLDEIKNLEPGLPDGNTFRQQNGLNENPIIALLPGSRFQELKRMLPVMSGVASLFPEYQFVIAGSASLNSDLYTRFQRNTGLKVITGQTYALLHNARAALVTSGTATLETALFRVPEVVCYKGQKISYLIARRLVKVKYISLVNLIMDREVVKELIQDAMHVENVKRELEKILDPRNATAMQAEFDILREKLGGEGASERTAQKMLEYLNEK